MWGVRVLRYQQECDSPCSPLLGFPPLPPRRIPRNLSWGAHRWRTWEVWAFSGSWDADKHSYSKVGNLLELSMSPKVGGANDPPHTEVRK